MRPRRPLPRLGHVSVPRRSDAPPGPMAPRRRRDRGIMLVLVLWMSVILGLMSYSVLYQMTIEARLGSARNRTNQATMLARAGLAKAFVDLRNDMIYDRNEEREGNPRFDAAGDIWADAEQDKLDYELGPGIFNVEVIDAESRFHLNRFTAANKILMEKIIEQIGYSEEDAATIAAAIIDYMDPDEVPLLENPEGTEGEAYGRLLAEAEGIRLRGNDDVPVAVFPNEPFLTVDALLDVYGVTPDLFFGPGTPEADYYNDLLGVRWGGKFEPTNRRRSRFAGPVVGLRDFFTLDGPGQINVNTAPRHVLQALIEAAGDTGAEQKADSLVRRRARSRNNTDVFKTIQDFQNASEIGGLMQPMMALHPLTVESTVFTVRSTGTVGGVNRTIEAVVERNFLQVAVNETFEELDRARDRSRIRQDRRARWEDPDNANVVNMPNLRILRWNPNSTAIANANYDGRRRR